MKFSQQQLRKLDITANKISKGKQNLVARKEDRLFIQKKSIASKFDGA